MFNKIVNRDKATVVSISAGRDMYRNREIRGELDQQLEDCATEDKCLLVRFDRLLGADSSLLATLVEAYQKARCRGVPFGLVAEPGSLTKLLKVFRLDGVLPVYPNLDKALAAIR